MGLGEGHRTWTSPSQLEFLTDVGGATSYLNASDGTHGAELSEQRRTAEGTGVGAKDIAPVPRLSSATISSMGNGTLFLLVVNDKPGGLRAVEERRDGDRNGLRAPDPHGPTKTCSTWPATSCFRAGPCGWRPVGGERRDHGRHPHREGHRPSAPVHAHRPHRPRRYPDLHRVRPDLGAGALGARRRTAAGTTLVKDIWRGNRSRASELTVVDGRSSANDGEHGKELAERRHRPGSWS